jgi:hypothetical protein
MLWQFCSPYPPVRCARSSQQGAPRLVHPPDEGVDQVLPITILATLDEVQTLLGHAALCCRQLESAPSNQALASEQVPSTMQHPSNTTQVHAHSIATTPALVAARPSATCRLRALYRSDPAANHHAPFPCNASACAPVPTTLEHCTHAHSGEAASSTSELTSQHSPSDPLPRRRTAAAVCVSSDPASLCASSDPAGRGCCHHPGTAMARRGTTRRGQGAGGGGELTARGNG